MISDISLTDGVIRNSEWVLAPTGTETYKTLYTMKLNVMSFSRSQSKLEVEISNFRLPLSVPGTRHKSCDASLRSVQTNEASVQIKHFFTALYPLKQI